MPLDFAEIQLQLLQRCKAHSETDLSAFIEFLTEERASAKLSQDEREAITALTAMAQTAAALGVLYIEVRDRVSAL